MKVSLDMFNSKTAKVATAVVVIFVVFLLFLRTSGQINKPVCVPMPFSKLEKGAVSQDNTQVMVTDKPWEVGGDIFAGRFDNKDFYGGRLHVAYKF